MGHYKIVRSFFNEKYGRELVAKGLTLTEARAHCSDPETSSVTAVAPAAVERTEQYGPWFDGYYDDE